MQINYFYAKNKKLIVCLPYSPPVRVLWAENNVRLVHLESVRWMTEYPVSVVSSSTFA